MPKFTPHQDKALKAASDWLNASPGQGNTPQIFRLFGFAGTGKTTLARHISEAVSGRTLFAAFTGKAALVMREKGCHNASTIHSLIYKPRTQEDAQPTFDLWDDAPASSASLIIVDECSMVDQELGRDLLSFGVPLLVLGDPAQLPPIQGGGFFTEHEPDAMLTEVHRQAKDDPIVRLSMQVREGEMLAPGFWGSTEVVYKSDLNPEKVINADQVLVGRNATRKAYNERMRERLGFEDMLPMAGDKLVCLRNNKAKQLFNGGLWNISEKKAKRGAILHFSIVPDEEPGAKPMKVQVRPECFLGGIEAFEWSQRKRYEEFDYGYVLTVHKSQGSQWDNCVLFDESYVFPDARRRWLYTGITRAAKSLTVVI